MVNKSVIVHVLTILGDHSPVHVRFTVFAGHNYVNIIPDQSAAQSNRIDAKMRIGLLPDLLG